MNTTKTFDKSLRRVEELERFGAALEMPKDAVKEQGKIMLKALREQFGFWGMIGVFVDMLLIERRLKKDHTEAKRCLSQGC